jgi:hypothetical protein
MSGDEAAGKSAETDRGAEDLPGSQADPGTEQRNWAPLAIAIVIVVAIAVAALVLGRPRHGAENLGTLPATPDPYAANLRISGLAMSESSNLAGGKVTYLDGEVANLGSQTVTEAVVEVTFRDFARKVAQSQRMGLTVIRMREPYIDTAPLSAVPLKPGAQVDFRLIFDAVSPDWAGEIPEIRVLHVTAK